MDVFQIKIDDDRPIQLNVKNYERYTKKSDPFYIIENNKLKYYAICPACKNPIQVINLYVDKKIDEHNNKLPLYAKHVKRSIIGVADYLQEAYDNCPMANPNKFGGNEKHRNKKLRNEIVSLIKFYPVVLFNEIRSITGIDFSEKAFGKMINTFIKAEGFYYKYITKYNLPYGFLNMQKSISIYNNKLYPSSIKNELIDNINKSNFFQFNKFHITPKSKDMFCEIVIYLANHKFDKKFESETIEIIIEEKFEEVSNVVYEKTIELNLEKYINTIEKQKRINSLTNNIILE